MHLRLRPLLPSAIVMALAASTGPLHASDWPARPVVVVPFAAKTRAEVARAKP